jgi:membrane protein YdbS with pleckstrin-like domain
MKTPRTPGRIAVALLVLGALTAAFMGLTLHSQRWWPAPTGAIVVLVAAWCLQKTLFRTSEWLNRDWRRRYREPPDDNA